MKIISKVLAVSLLHRWLLAGALLSMAGATAAYVTLPWLYGSAVDKIAKLFESGETNDTAIIRIAVTILAVSAVRGALSFGQTYLAEALAQRVIYDLRNSFYDRVQNANFGFHDKHHTGNLMSRAITDIEAIGLFVNTGLVRAPYWLLLFTTTTVILLWRDWRLGLVSLGLMPLLAVVSAIARLHLRRIWLRVQEGMADLSTVLQENLTGVRVVKAFAAEEQEMANYDAKSKHVLGDMVRVARLQTMNTSFLAFVYLVTIGLILWYGGSRVIGEQITPGELAGFLFYMQLLAMPIRHTGVVVSNFARAISAGQRLFEVLEYESPIRESSNAVEMPRVRGHVRFEDVGFSYDNGAPVLNNISIDAKPGSVVALLGAPGSGKSSLVHLLPRFYDLTSGRITMDGTDIRELTLKSLRRNIGLVQQDVFLFATSLRENIAYGRGDATMDEIVEAARVAQLDEFIESLEDGYETQIGERGATLSGGQRQRLSIARTVLMDPPVLVLDDATSSVDANTEEMIRRAMETVMRGRTTFVIAHRLSTVYNADEILVLEEGGIAERGSHFELLERNGLYRRIYDLQLRPQEEVMMEFDVPEYVGERSRAP
jgi:ATP-binding cassette subfamily B protein